MIIDIYISGTSVSAKIVNLKNGRYVYKEKERRKWVDIAVNEKDIFEIERYCLSIKQYRS